MGNNEPFSLSFTKICDKLALSSYFANFQILMVDKSDLAHQCAALQRGIPSLSTHGKLSKVLSTSANTEKALALAFNFKRSQILMLKLEHELQCMHSVEPQGMRW